MKVRSLSEGVFVLGAAVVLGLAPSPAPAATGGECDQPAALYRCSEYQGIEADLCRNYLKALEQRCASGARTPAPEVASVPAAVPEPPALIVAAEVPGPAPAPEPVKIAAAVPAPAAPPALAPSREEAPRRPAKTAREVPAPEPAPEPAPFRVRAEAASPAPAPPAPSVPKAETPRRPARVVKEVPVPAPAPVEEPAPAPVPPSPAETPAPVPPGTSAEPEARPPAPVQKPAVRPAPAPPAGKVTRAEGSYLLCNRGSAAGALVGQKVKILRDGRQVGSGVVVGVRRDSSDVEVLSLTGVSAIRAGDRIEPMKPAREERKR